MPFGIDTIPCSHEISYIMTMIFFLSLCYVQWWKVLGLLDCLNDNFEKIKSTSPYYNLHNSAWRFQAAFNAHFPFYWGAGWPPSTGFLSPCRGSLLLRRIILCSAAFPCFALSRLSPLLLLRRIPTPRWRSFCSGWRNTSFQTARAPTDDFLEENQPGRIY